MLKRESDRGCVLDEALTKLLQACFIATPEILARSIKPLMAANGPFVSFWSKLHLRNALGLISSSVASDLEIIRRLRNGFAHSQEEVNFHDSAAIRLVEQLSTTPHYSELMKGKRYAVRPSPKGEMPSDYHLREDGLLKYPAMCFAWCTELTLQSLHMTRHRCRTTLGNWARGETVVAGH
jgi:hypothetical protein